jgi:hypothetical protein
MQQMQQYNQGAYGSMQGMSQSQFMSHHQMSHMNSMGRMSMMGGLHQPRMMGGPGMAPANNSNMPIRAGGPSINPGGMRMPTTMDSRMFSGGPPGAAGGRPTPYPNPAMYMAQKRHQSPIYAGGGGGPMSHHHHHQYMAARAGPYPLPQQGSGGYPMGHPHTMGGGPGPGFSGMPPVMRHHGGGGGGVMMGPGGMPPMTAMGPQNFPVSAAAQGMGVGNGGGMNSVMNRSSVGGGGVGGQYPGGPMQSAGGPPGGMFPGAGGRPKAEIPTVSPRGGGGGANTASGLSPFQHSPVPGNPTPPLTPNGPGNCVSAPFASPQSEHGSSSSGSDSKPNFSLASKFVLRQCSLSRVFWLSCSTSFNFLSLFLMISLQKTLAYAQIHTRLARGLLTFPARV